MDNQWKMEQPKGLCLIFLLQEAKEAVSTNFIKKCVLGYIELKIISQVYSDAYLYTKWAEHVSSCEQGYVSTKTAFWILGNSPYHRLQTKQK